MNAEPRELVRFEGTIGRPGDPYYRLALSRDWLHEVTAGPVVRP